MTIEGLFEDRQGERAIMDVLKDMGADISFEGSRATVKGGNALRGVEFNGDRATDAVLAMVGAACFAQGASRFYNVENLRIKECDRITEPLLELRRIGVHAEEKKDEIIIQGNPAGYEGGIEVDGRKDHRVIMLLTIVGLRTYKGITISGAEHIAKSYPDFFLHLQNLGVRMEMIQSS
jgi:3-phosphoshikimate 1-carboxyvinyltransferase